jgi:hypothetical protein
VHEAAQYCRDRKKQRLFRMEGPAAPATYRALYHLMGFSLTEKLARQLR